eukprot:305417_1
MHHIAIVFVVILYAITSSTTIVKDPIHYKRVLSPDSVAILDVLDEITIQFDFEMNFPAIILINEVTSIFTIHEVNSDDFFQIQYNSTEKNLKITTSVIFTQQFYVYETATNSIHPGRPYSLFVQQTQNSLNILILQLNNSISQTVVLPSHSILFNHNIFLGSNNGPQDTADGTISNLFVSTTNTEFNYFCDGSNRLTAVRGSWVFDDTSCSIQQVSSSYQGAQIWLGNNDPTSLKWTNYQIETEITITNSDADGAGILFRSQSLASNRDDTASTYSVQIGLTRIALHRFHPSSATLLKSVTFSMSLNKAYKLKVDVTGSTFTIYVDNKYKMSYSDVTYSYGSIGLRTYQARTTFSNLKIIFASDNYLHTINPTTVPTFDPTSNPTISPTFDPTNNPTFPTISPTFMPTEFTLNPSKSPILHFLIIKNGPCSDGYKLYHDNSNFCEPCYENEAGLGGICAVCHSGTHPSHNHTQCILCKNEMIGSKGYCQVNCLNNNKKSNELHTECIEKSYDVYEEEQEGYNFYEINISELLTVFGSITVFIVIGCMLIIYYGIKRQRAISGNTIRWLILLTILLTIFSSVSSIALTDIFSLSDDGIGIVIIFMSAYSLWVISIKITIDFRAERKSEYDQIHYKTKALAVFASSLTDIVFDCLQGLAIISGESYTDNAFLVVLFATWAGVVDELFECFIELFMDSDVEFVIKYKIHYGLVMWSMIETALSIYLLSTYRSIGLQVSGIIVEASLFIFLIKCISEFQKRHRSSGINFGR